MSKTDMNAMIRRAAGRPVSAEELNTVKNGLKAPTKTDMNAALRSAAGRPISDKTGAPVDGLSAPTAAEMNQARQKAGESNL